MGRATVEFADFAGVDSRSSPLRLPPGRALRTKIWVPKPNGVLQLRHGYTRPAISPANAARPIHSAAYYELHAGTQEIIYSQTATFNYVPAGHTIAVPADGSSVRLYDVPSATSILITNLFSMNPWNGTFADNRFMFGNGPDRKYWDGSTLRDVGIPSAEGALAAVVHSGTISIITAYDPSIAVASYSTASTGTWETTSYLGYQMFMCYYNPVSGHVGNRVPIGARFTVPVAGGRVNLTNLPNLALFDRSQGGFYDTGEWVKLIGRTGDNGLVPNALINNVGDWIVVGNTLTTASIVSPATDPEAELPTRNGLPPNFHMVAWVLNRAYAIDDDDPSGIMFSESLADVPSGQFVGDARQAWPAASKVFFPTGERCRGIHGVDNEAWVWTRNHLGILTEQQSTDVSLGRPMVQWRGTWVGGIANHRAFAKTRYGPFWVSADKQLMTRAESGPIPVSLEYDAALLARVVDLDSFEMAYLLDPEKDIDCLYIKGLDVNGGDVVVVHDFGAGGIGREHSYSDLAHISTFVRNPDQRVSMRDAAGKMRLWASSNLGQFTQLEDGDQDGPSTLSTVSGYNADGIMLFNAGPKEPTFGAFEWFGDGQVQISVSKDLRLTLQDLDNLESLQAI